MQVEDHLNCHATPALPLIPPKVERVGSGEGIVLLLPDDSDDEGEEMQQDKGLQLLVEKVIGRVLTKGTWDASL